MTPSKKTILLLIYVLLAINLLLLGGLLIAAFPAIQAKGQPPAAGNPPEIGDPPAPTAAPMAAPMAAAAAAGASPAQPPESGPSGTNADPSQEKVEPENVASGSRIYLALVQRYVPQPFVAKNVIVLIGDGMGLEHVKAGSMYAYGAPGEMPFEHFPYHAQMSTHSNSGLTDSAAAATAMATGYKVNNKVIGLAIPGDGAPYTTLLEYASAWNMSTGLITTTSITHATPAGFAAHTEVRENEVEIAQDYLQGSRPNVLFGGGSTSLTEEVVSAAGYRVITDRDALLALDTEAEMRVSGLFGPGYMPYEIDGLGDLPHLSEMTAVALRILDNDPDGFFIMIEGGRIDGAAHANNAEAMVGEMAEFGRTVQAAVDWAAGRSDTLIIVTADHETGGLQVIQNNGQGVVPDVTFSTTRHTGDSVGLWASGKQLYYLTESVDNTQIPMLITAGEFYKR